MSRTDYEAFASHIREQVRQFDTPRDNAKIKMVVFAAEMICTICGRENPRFDRERFLEAAGIADLEKDRKIVEVIEGTTNGHVCDALDLLRFMKEFKDGGAQEINFSALYKNDEQTVGQALDNILHEAAQKALADI